MKIVLIENNAENLYPITLTRPTFDILCGGTTLYKALKAEFPQASFEFKVRDYIQAYTDKKFGTTQESDEKVLFIDASVIPDIKTIKELASLVGKGNDFVATNNLVGYSNSAQSLEEIKGETVELNFKTFEKVSDVIVVNNEILKSNLEYLKQGLNEIKPEVFVGENVKIAEQVVFNTEGGPIILEDGVRISPFTVLFGPLSIGKNSSVHSFSGISDSSIGEVCKIAGEIGESIFQGYSNKQHSGGIGHSYVGEWVNIGGGTWNSDMKNTLGTVKMAGVDTGEQFLGCVIGDYTKTSISTLIYTGKVIGVSSFLYDNVKNDLPSFTNLLENDKLIECPLDIAHKVQKATRDRREVATSELDKMLLEDVYNLTKDDRKKFKVKRGKLK